MMKLVLDDGIEISVDSQNDLGLPARVKIVLPKFQEEDLACGFSLSLNDWDHLVAFIDCEIKQRKNLVFLPMRPNSNHID
jgi:hypothetical protein